ncbi:SMI1/KNR4 family protein [Rhodococcus qingshengii]|uniref:SMI1/KNR4 family protein n=1 Tax=Rhodococcus qingshengii TaxID=334542 RepID=UPI00364CE3CF
MFHSALVDFDAPVLILGPRPREPYAHTYGKIMGLSPAVVRLVLSSTAGPVRITVDTADADPEFPTIDDWETIEEGTIESVVAGLPPLRLTGERIHEFGFLEGLPLGLYRIRAAVRGRDTDRTDPEAFIQIWPVTEVEPTRLYKSGDRVEVRDVYSDDGYLPIPARPGSVQHNVAAGIRARSATDPTTVRRQWERIADWFSENGFPQALDVFAPGAEQSEIDRVEAQTGIVWPTELKDFYSAQNGFAPGAWMQFLPQHDMLNLDALLAHHREAPAVYELPDVPESVPTLSDRAQPAGTPSGKSLPDYITFAERDGYELFCDTRQETLAGCVTEYARENADDAGPQWTSISAMLADLAESLETGQPFAGGWIPQLSDGAFAWQWIPQ